MAAEKSAAADILAAATAQFDARRIHPIAVPEWAADDGAPRIVYCRPMSIADRAEIRRHVKGDMESPEIFAVTVMIRALDADGKRLFSVENKHTLLHSIDPDVLRRVALEMMTVPSKDQAEKN